LIGTENQLKESIVFKPHPCVVEVQSICTKRGRVENARDPSRVHFFGAELAKSGQRQNLISPGILNR